MELATKEAHKALRTLLDQLERLNTDNLQPGGQRIGRTKTVDEWEFVLRTAAEEIEEWCPSFTINLDPR